MTVAVAQLRSEAEGEEEQAALFSSYLLKEFEGLGRAIREGGYIPNSIRHVSLLITKVTQLSQLVTTSL